MREIMSPLMSFAVFLYSTRIQLPSTAVITPVLPLMSPSMTTAQRLPMNS